MKAIVENDTENQKSVRVPIATHTLLSKIKRQKGISISKFISDSVQEKVTRDYKKLD